MRSRAALHAEILALRHQLLVLQRSTHGRRLRLRTADRIFWVWLSRLWQGWRLSLRIIKPETVIAWNRKGFRLYWTWKSRARNGRPCASREIQELIKRMSMANPRWGAPRIHGELQKLGIQVSESTVAKYMVRPRRPSSQTWRTFLKNHTRDLVSTDFFVVPTATFRLLFVFLMLSHDRRRIVHFGVTSHPTAEWTALQTASRFSLGHSAEIHSARPGFMLRRTLPSDGSGVEHPGDPERTALSLAERLCRKANRLDPA
jgi:putative transposase